MSNRSTRRKAERVKNSQKHKAKILKIATFEKKQRMKKNIYKSLIYAFITALTFTFIIYSAGCVTRREVYETYSRGGNNTK